MEIRAYGKMNYTLKVYRYNRKKNLHRIKSIMFPVQEQYDLIEMFPSIGMHTIFKTNNTDISCEDNTVMISYRLFLKFFPVYKKDVFEINLHKNTTIGSGLGYSASDGVAIIKLLCEYYRIKYYSKKIRNLIKKISSDALFFYKELPALVSNYGNKIKYLSRKKIKAYRKKINIVQTKICSITKDVFAEFDRQFSYYATNFDYRSRQYYNMLQNPAFAISKELYEQYLLLKKSYQNVMLAGSGGSFLVW